jgi:hypothetical protein
MEDLDCSFYNEENTTRSRFSTVAQHVILWGTNPLLGKNLETNNETTVVAIQRSVKHSSTAKVTVGNGVFYVIRAKELS